MDAADAGSAEVIEIITVGIPDGIHFDLRAFAA